MRKRIGVVLTITGLLACPCHLPLALPLLAVIGGTALGAWLTAHSGWLIALSTLYFIGALIVGLRLLTRSDPHAVAARELRTLPPMPSSRPATVCSRCLPEAPSVQEDHVYESVTRR
ncbi:hypothetical protein [Kallotenue papyrolyticum]|uniref:hypothetical protein n=1 Tax=Kallotenue papyrolyticum TaxID=1325125 RepID=UPI0004922674|nr:hypothetical protein [Kallotenue papyrolyticum]